MSQKLTAKALREQRAQVIADARKILDKAEAEKRACTAEERLKWAELVGDVKRDEKGQPILGADGQPERMIGEEERLRDRIADLEKQEGLEAGLQRPAGDRTIGRDDVDGREEQRREEQATEQLDPATLSLAERRARLSSEDRAYAIQGWIQSGRGDEITPRHRAALERCKAAQDCYASGPEFVVNLRLDYRKMLHEHRQMGIGVESRALSVSSQPAGGYTIPEGFVNNLEVALKQYGGVRQVADVMRTTSGQDLPWPTVSDFNNKGSLVAENTAGSGGTQMTFGALVFHAYKYTSSTAGGAPILVPVELIEDSAFNLAEELGTLLGIRIGRITSDDFSTGNGAAKPTGIVTAATLGVTAASATAIAADDLYGLKHAVDPAYRVGPGVGWMFHDLVLLAIKKLKDGLGRYLWQAGLAGGVPDTIDGDGYTINQSMASSITNSAIVVLYGMLSKFKIRDVAEVRLRRLVERYADADQEGFVMFSRHDSNLLDAGSHPVQTYQMHS